MINNNSFPPKIHVISADKWDGDLVLMITTAAETSTLDSPGKETGDIRILANKDGYRKGFLSLGAAEKVNLETFRKTGGLAYRWLSKYSHQEVAFDFSLSPVITEGRAAALDAFCQGILLAAFRFDKHKSETKPVDEIGLTILAEPEFLAVCHQTVEHTQVICQAVNLARQWAHEPPNVINPVTLANQAMQLADDVGLRCTILDERHLAEIGAGAILAVGQGSHTPARLIILEHPGNHPDERPIVLVGKAITFDTGGYSLKDRTGMVGMKYDKCGGMDVMAILQAAASLNLERRVVGIIAAAENMISGEAYRPNDILTTLSGKTVEVISADAEGRLVLCDALTYAQRFFQPRLVIDLATLTGGVVVALGKVRAGILGNNQKLIDALIQTGAAVHERLWQLPIDDEYLEPIKGDDSDLKNSGSRDAHATTGAIFLKQFVDDDIPWAHLDIAGVADIEKDTAYCPKGATGFGVRLLLHYLDELGNA